MLRHAPYGWRAVMKAAIIAVADESVRKLARTIPSAYQIESPRIEVFELLFPLRPEERLTKATAVI